MWRVFVFYIGGLGALRDKCQGGLLIGMRELGLIWVGAMWERDVHLTTNKMKMPLFLKLLLSSIQIANLVPKRFYYFDGQHWPGPFTRAEIKSNGLNEDNLVWWPGICPDKTKHPKDCKHDKRTLKQIKEENKTPILILSIIAIIIITSIVSSYPYIFDSGANKSSEEIETQIKLEIEGLKLDLRSTKKTNFYEINKIPTSQLVDNYVGNYYIVNLQNASLNEKIIFPTGKYVLDDLSFDYINALNKFMNEFYIKLDNGLRVELFVKGSADYLGHENFKSALDLRYNSRNGFDRFEYLPSIEGKEFLFSSKSKIQTIGNEFNNTELPNLRGKFIQYKIKENYPQIGPPILLEGMVKKEINTDLRNANIFLFADWETIKYKSKENEGNIFNFILRIIFLIFVISLIVILISLFRRVLTQLI
jgi:hypothetical protein